MLVALRLTQRLDALVCTLWFFRLWCREDVFLPLVKHIGQLRQSILISFLIILQTIVSLSLLGLCVGGFCLISGSGYSRGRHTSSQILMSPQLLVNVDFWPFLRRSVIDIILFGLLFVLLGCGLMLWSFFRDAVRYGDLVIYCRFICVKMVPIVPRLGDLSLTTRTISTHLKSI